MSNVTTFDNYIKASGRRVLKLGDAANPRLLSYFGSQVALKTVDSKNRIVEGHLIPYTPPFPIDLHEQFFDATTETMPEQYPIIDKNGVGIPLLFNHGFDPAFGSTKIGQFIYAEEIESGWWTQAQLKQYDEYVELLDSVNKRRDFGYSKDQVAALAKSVDDSLMTLVKAEILGFSSGSRPPDVRVAQNGHIVVWLPIEGSLTATPAARKGTDARLVKSVKDAQLLQTLTAMGEPLIEVGDNLEASELDDNVDNDEPIIVITGAQSGATDILDDEPPLDSGDDDGEPVDNADDESLSINGVKTMEELISQLQNLLNMLLEEFGAQDDEMPPETAQSLVEQAARDAGVTAETATPTTVQIQQAEVAIAKSAAKYVADARQKREQASQAETEKSRRRAIELREQFAPLSSGVGAQGGALPGRVTTQSRKYADMSPSDMAYYHVFMKGIARHRGMTYEPDVDFMPEMLSKIEELKSDPHKYFNPEFDKTPESPTRYAKSVHTHLNALRGMSRQDMHAAVKANELMHTGQAGYGAEWVPDLWLSQIQELSRVDNVVAPRLMSIPMPSNPYNIPLEGADPIVESVPETTAITELTNQAGNPMTLQKIPSAKTQLDAKKLALRVGMSSEQEEDNIVPIIPIMRRKGQRAVLDAIDSVLLNADPDTGTTNINSSGAAPAAKTDYLLGWTGMLHDALSTIATYGVNAGNAAPTIQMIRNVRKAMPKRYGSKLNELAWFADYKTYVTLTNIEQFLTVDKIGNDASVLTGIVGRLDGIPVYMTGELEESASTGLIDGVTPANNTQGRLVLVHTQSRWMGYRRQPTVNVIYKEEFDAYIMIATVRIAYTQYDSDGVTLLYNIAV